MVVIVRTLAYVDTRAAKYWWLLLGLVLVLGGAYQAQAADLLEPVKNQEIKQVLRLRVGHSKVLRTPFIVSRISMADPEIADLILIAEKEIYVNALSPGVTNLSLWGKTRFTTATVTVEAFTALGFNVPGLRVRRLWTNVGMEDGQNFDIAGPLPLGFGPQAVE
jgi:Flp pilus assembly secretin CpaC